MLYDNQILTFNLPVLEFILKGIRGNGLALGLTNGTENFGLANQRTYAYCSTGLYGAEVGTTPAGLSNLEKATGITQDSLKSGIESEINSNIKYVIKY